MFLSFCSVILVDGAPVCIVFIFIRYAKRKRITHNGMLPIWTIGNQNYFCAVRYCICTNINREITGDEVGKRNGRCTIHGICIGIGSFIICLQFHRHVACGSIRNLKQFTCIGRICNQRLRNSTCNSYILCPVISRNICERLGRKIIRGVIWQCVIIQKFLTVRYAVSVRIHVCTVCFYLPFHKIKQTVFICIIGIQICIGITAC